MSFFPIHINTHIIILAATLPYPHTNFFCDDMGATISGTPFDVMGSTMAGVGNLIQHPKICSQYYAMSVDIYGEKLILISKTTQKFYFQILG